MSTPDARDPRGRRSGGERHHERWAELVAGHAVSALEPADEQEVLAHLAACAACERELEQHRATLGHLAYAAGAAAPPPSLWEGIRAAVERDGRPVSFRDDDESDASGALVPFGRRADDPVGEPVAAGPVVDLAAERRRRRVVQWSAAAAVLAVLLGAGGWRMATLQRDRDQQLVLSDRLSQAVGELSAAPARTVPLHARDGHVPAVAVVHSDRLSLLVDGLPATTDQDCLYVLWGQTGKQPAEALASFDVRDGAVDVVQDLPLPADARPVPDLLVLTCEPGHTVPDVSSQPALATGRSA